jgi:uncharacterized protein YcbK (DUF882 family)
VSHRALALVVLALGLAGPRGALADAASVADPAALPKKDRERLAKTVNRAPVPRPGTKPTRVINLYNRWTHDWLAVDPKQLPTRHQIDVFLRDHYTNKPTRMDEKLITTVIDAARQFKREVVAVVSGFRHPKYNLMLRKKGRQVARDSQHTHGTAVDFTFPDIDQAQLDKLHAWAKSRRLGGVGIYQKSRFVHIDTGPIRYWSGD